MMLQMIFHNRHSWTITAQCSTQIANLVIWIHGDYAGMQSGRIKMGQLRKPDRNKQKMVELQQIERKGFKFQEILN